MVPMTDATLTIRRAHPLDAGGLRRLAALDSAAPPTGETLVAEVGGELWAAIEVDTGAAVADPFRPSGDLVRLLELRVGRVRGPSRSRLPARAPRRGRRTP